MEFLEQKLCIEVPQVYVNSYAKKIGNIIWNKFESSYNIQTPTFLVDDEVELNIYFLSTEEDYALLISMIRQLFPQAKIKKD